jgi:NitT/TauT family transport system permease protein
MRLKRGVPKLLSVLLALAVWALAARAVNAELLLASPLAVLVRLGELARTADFWATACFSLGHIALGFALAFAAGVTAAAAAGRFPAVETLLWPYVTLIKTVPVVSFIILSLLFLSARQLSVFISFLMVFPILYSNVLQGLRSTNRDLAEMAALYCVPWGRRALYIELPQLEPYLLSGCSAALGLAWKSGVAAEVIGVAEGSIGEKLYESKIYFLTADLLAWTVVIVLLSAAFEKLVVLALRRGFRRLERL